MELKEKQKDICLLIPQHISVNNNLTLIVFFRCPGVLSYQTIAISMHGDEYGYSPLDLSEVYSDIYQACIETKE